MTMNYRKGNHFFLINQKNKKFERGPAFSFVSSQSVISVGSSIGRLIRNGSRCTNRLSVSRNSRVTSEQYSLMCVLVYREKSKLKIIKQGSEISSSRV